MPVFRRLEVLQLVERLLTDSGGMCVQMLWRWRSLWQAQADSAGASFPAAAREDGTTRRSLQLSFHAAAWEGSTTQRCSLQLLASAV